MGTIGSCFVGAWVALLSSGAIGDHPTPPTPLSIERLGAAGAADVRRTETNAPHGPTQPSSVDRVGGEMLQPDAVRLRRMHLVRPDLIPYPTFRNVYA